MLAVVPTEAFVTLPVFRAELLGRGDRARACRLSRQCVVAAKNPSDACAVGVLSDPQHERILGSRETREPCDEQAERREQEPQESRAPRTGE